MEDLTYKKNKAGKNVPALFYIVLELTAKQSFKEVDDGIPDIRKEITAFLKEAVCIKVEVNIVKSIPCL